MSLPHHTRRLSVDELFERTASIANFAMLRAYEEPSHLQIAAINEYASLLESKLRFLSPDDVHTRESILAQLHILAPIRRLPKELLFEIFYQVANESSLRTLHAAVTISRVCAVWRAVAHGLSKLWTRSVVKSTRDFDQYCELFLPMTTEKRRPSLRCDDPKILRRLWSHIEPYASCWSSLTLVDQLSTFPDLQVLLMENLERLVVDAYDSPDSSELSVLDFVVAPRLRHIALTLDVLQSERPLHVPSARALASPEIDGMCPFPVTCTLPLLRACADTLQSRALKARRPLDGPDGSCPLSASEQDTFDLSARTGLRLVDPACALLDHITAPRITVPILSNVPAYGSRALLGLLTRSQQQSRALIDLRVYTPAEREPSTWIPCIRLMDSLRDLHFDAMLTDTEFLTSRHISRGLRAFPFRSGM